MKTEKNKISVVSTVLLVIMVIFMLFPFYIMLIGAFKPNAELIKLPVDLTPFKHFTLKYVKKVLEESDIIKWFLNSLTVSLSVCLLTILIGLSAGYAFAKIKFRGKTLFFSLVLATMMMPKQVLIIPNFLVAQKLGLTNTRIGLILTSIAPAFAVFISRQSISSLPSELFDAAEMDGCGEIRKFFRIVVPLSLPSVGTIGILSFFAVFNDYIWQLIMISDKELKTLPIGVSYFSEMQNNNKAIQLAMALLATIPTAVIFLCGQKFFIRKATEGAVKG